MSDLSAYRDKVANYGKLANQAEQDKNYEAAFEYYTKALDIFSHMMKCNYPSSLFPPIRIHYHEAPSHLTNCYLDEKNPKLKEIYSKKANEYIERATYIKKQVLSPEQAP